MIHSVSFFFLFVLLSSVSGDLQPAAPEDLQLHDFRHPSHRQAAGGLRQPARLPAGLRLPLTVAASRKCPADLRHYRPISLIGTAFYPPPSPLNMYLCL